MMNKGKTKRDVFLNLLYKYYDAREDDIYEYSVNIKKDIQDLDKLIKRLKDQYNNAE